MSRGRDLIELTGGRFRMGSEGPEAIPSDREGPVRTVEIAPFAISATAVSNAEFAAFADATGHRTRAERSGWSFVFQGLLSPARLAGSPGMAADAPWWRAVVGASWRHPEGAGSSLRGRSGHPVVHVSHADALAYCAWADLRLPAEAEWEFAARGGLEGARFPWGHELCPGGEWRCNVWQGSFPDHDTGEDGYRGTAPVDAYPPNAFGLFNAVGNVWEWTADRFTTGEGRVARGGSYLCHDSYCNRFRTSARMALDPDSATGNIGFRCAGG